MQQKNERTTNEKSKGRWCWRGEGGGGHGRGREFMQKIIVFAHTFDTKTISYLLKRKDACARAIVHMHILVLTNIDGHIFAAASI